MEPRKEIAQIVEALRGDQKVSGFAKAVGKSAAWIYRLETEDDYDALPSPDFIDALFKASKAPKRTELRDRLRAVVGRIQLEKKIPADLRPAPPDPEPNARPILGAVSCGPFLRGGSDPRDALGELPAAPVRPEWTRNDRAFWVRASGDSMTGETVDIREGDLVLVEPGVEPRNDDLAIVMIDEGATLKIWRLTGKRGPDEPFVELVPANPAHKTIRWLKSEWKQRQANVARVAGWLPGFRRIE